MSYDSIMTWVPMESNSAIDRACRFLERMGHRFCIDFGLDNAIDIANCKYEGWDSDYDSWSANVCPQGAD